MIEAVTLLYLSKGISSGYPWDWGVLALPYPDQSPLVGLQGGWGAQRMNMGWEIWVLENAIVDSQIQKKMKK